MQPMNVGIMLELGNIKAEKGDKAAAESIFRECVKLTDDSTCHKKWKEMKKVQKAAALSLEAAATTMKEALAEVKELKKSHKVFQAFKKTEEIVTKFRDDLNITDPANKVLKQVWPLQCRLAAQTDKFDDVLTACQNVIDTIQVLKTPSNAADKKKAQKQTEERATALKNLGRAYLEKSPPNPDKGFFF